MVYQHGITPEAFMDFIAKQDKDDAINHWRWSSCAVGDFLKPLLVEDVIEIDYDVDSLIVKGREICLTNIARYICSKYDKGDLFEALNTGGVVTLMGVQDIDTYGELHAYIQTLDAQSPNDKSDSALLFDNMDDL